METQVDGSSVTGVRKSRRLSLQTCLIALVLLVLVPTLGVVGMTLLHASQSYRDASSLQLLETANVVAQSVTSELEATSRLLAGYAALRHDNAVGTDASQANALLKGTTGVTLFAKGPAGLSAVGEAGDAAVTTIALAAAQSQKTAVSNIVSLGGDASPRIALAVPGGTKGPYTEVVTLTAKPADLIRSLVRQGDAAGSVVLAITDGSGHVVGRSIDPDRFIGQPVPDWATLVALGTSSGTFQARTIEGGGIMFAFQQIEGTPGWVAVVGEPLNIFNGRWQQPVIVMIVASAATILAAILLAALLAGRILKPIKQLARRARAITAGNMVTTGIAAEVPPSFVSEFETLRQSLDGAEAALRISLEESHVAGDAAQKNYKALQAAERLARMGSWTLDLATGEFTFSDMLHELNGTDPNGPPPTAALLATLMTPESFRQISAGIARCAETGEPYAMEVDHLHTDGTAFTAFVRGQAIRDENGKIVRLGGTVQDISENREIRERLAALADNLPNGAIFRLERGTDGHTGVPYISAGIERLLGITAAEIFEVPTVFADAVHPDDQASYLTAMEHSVRVGDVLDHEFRMIRRDGRLIWMHSRSAVRRLPDGRVIWDGIVSDVTGEQEVAAALRAAKETAEAAERTKSDFLATMSHEIRTPMNTVVGMTRLTLQTDLAPKQRNYLEKIDASARVLLGIINDILDFSKIEAGGLELEETVFSLESVLESVSALTAIRAEEKELEIAFAVAPNTPPLLKGDSLRLGQILTNLVSNAVKFTEAGEVVVSIAPAADGQLQFSVRDTGIGLDDDQIAGLFQPFSQAGTDTSRKYGGTGLGLAICKRLVEMMGGQIWVESTPGEGSTFFFTVALAAVDKDTAPDILAHPSNYLKDRRILIVDDNASAREVLADMVSEFGMAAATATSGEEALTLLHAGVAEDHPFDIVLMDWRMPDMDGLETARRIRADASLPRMPAVLMVTAYGREEVLQGAEQIGLDGVLIKPVTQSVMFNTVLGILSRPGSTRNLHQAFAGVAASASDDILFGALRGRRVLVVDDNALNREVAGDFLALAGITTQTAVNGRDALRVLDLEEFDAVLMDMHMPEMDGLAAVREIRKQSRWANLPVIALTAQARVEDHHASRDAGMTAHLTKPIDENALYRTLAEVLAVRPPVAGGPDRTSTRGAAKPAADFDLAAIMRRFGGKTERVERLLKGFLRDFSDAPQLLDRMLQAGDWEQVADLAHLLKGSVGYFGAGPFHAAAQALEQSGRREDADATMRDAPQFRLLLERLLNDIHGGLAALPASPPASPPAITIDALLAMVAKAEPLVARGDYAAKTLLDQIGAGLKGHPAQALAEEAMTHYDDLELEAAEDALTQLKARLGSALP
ncbi:MAG TPA: response regulator [Devosiaceae bacterium]|jgi:PAS domain S-box-containing protein